MTKADEKACRLTDRQGDEGTDKPRDLEELHNDGAVKTFVVFPS